MAGKKQTNKALQPRWQGTLRQADTTQQPTHPKTLIIGISEHGNQTITQLTKTKPTTTPTAIITTNPKLINNSHANHKILINIKPANQTTTPPKLETILDKTDIIFLTTNLENNTECEIATIITQAAQRKDTTIVGVITTPPQNAESKSKLVKFRQQWDTTILINDKTLKQQLPQIPTEETKPISQQVSATIIKSMIEVLSNPNQDNPVTIGTLFEKGGAALVGIGESTTLNNAEEAACNTLHNSLLNTNPAEPLHTIVHVTGNRSITVDEVDHLQSFITESMRSNSLIWGAKVDPELNGRFRVTVIITGINPPNPTTNLSTITPQLFNLEPYSTREKKLPIDLDLHQLENF